MKHKTKGMGILTIWFLVTFLWASMALGVTTATFVNTFDDLTPTTPYTGPGGGAYWNGADGSGGFTSGDTWFTNQYTSSYWSGWAYSNTKDTSTPGSTNQFSAIRRCWWLQ